MSALVAANQFSFLPSLPGSPLPQEAHDVFGAAHKACLRYQQRLWKPSVTRAAAGN